jgi:hypothetical protein
MPRMISMRPIVRIDSHLPVHSNAEPDTCSSWTTTLKIVTGTPR